MNFKTTYWLFGILLVLVLGIALRLTFGGKSAAGGSYLLGGEGERPTAEQINTLEIEPKEPAGPKWVFVRRGPGEWRLAEPVPARVQSSTIDGIVDSLCRATRDTKNLPKNLADAGLAPPSLVITLKQGAERSWQVNVGNVAFGSPARTFVTTGAAPKDLVALSRNTLDVLLNSNNTGGGKAAEMLRPLDDFRDRDLLSPGLSPQTAQAVTLEGGGKSVVLKRASEGRWRFEKPDGFGDADPTGDNTDPQLDKKPPTGVEPLLTAVTSLKVADNAFIDHPGPAAQYGLDPTQPTDGIRIEVQREGAPPEVLRIGKKVEKKPDDKGPDRVYAQLQGEPTVVEVGADTVALLRQLLDQPAVLRDRGLIRAASGSIDALDVRLGEQPPLELGKGGSPVGWQIYDSSGTAKKANSLQVQQLLDALTQPQAVKSFPPPGTADAAMGLDKPAVTLSLWVNGLQAEEPPKEGAPPAPAKRKLKEPTKPTFRLLIGNPVGEDRYARRVAADNSTSDLLLPKALVEKAIGHRTTTQELRLDYVDPTLPSFTLDTAAKLTIVRGAETVEIDREKRPEGDAWVIKQPTDQAGLADANKVTPVLLTLASLRPARLISEDAPDPLLEDWGLKAKPGGPPAPRVRATVKLADGKERVYLFGNDAEDKANVYAKLGDSPTVFVVGQAVLTPLQTAEWKDPTIFHFDRNAVASVTFRGEPNVVANGTVTLDRQGENQYTVKGGGYEVDGPRVEGVLRSLETVRSASVVSRKNEVKPEYKLDLPAGALEIEIVLKGQEKDPIKLTVGGPVPPGGATFYAISNKAANEIFQVDRGPFAPLKDKTIYFKKGA
jgi:hypothetical protein